MKPPEPLHLHLHRHLYAPTHTAGTLTINDLTIHTLERPWLGNATNISCIPPGTYRTDFLPRSTSGKYRRVYWIRHVDGRGGILIHCGNLVRHTLGCILVGTRHGYLQGNPAILNSRTALSKLRLAAGTVPLLITITPNPPQGETP